EPAHPAESLRCLPRSLAWWEDTPREKPRCSALPWPGHARLLALEIPQPVPRFPSLEYAEEASVPQHPRRHLSLSPAYAVLPPPPCLSSDHTCGQCSVQCKRTLCCPPPCHALAAHLRIRCRSRSCRCGSSPAAARSNPPGVES